MEREGTNIEPEGEKEIGELLRSWWAYQNNLFVHRFIDSKDRTWHHFKLAYLHETLVMITTLRVNKVSFYGVIKYEIRVSIAVYSRIRP